MHRVKRDRGPSEAIHSGGAEGHSANIKPFRIRCQRLHRRQPTHHWHANITLGLQVTAPPPTPTLAGVSSVRVSLQWQL